MHWERDSCCWIIVSMVKGFMWGLQWFRFCSFLGILVYFIDIYIPKNVSPDMFNSAFQIILPLRKSIWSTLFIPSLKHGISTNGLLAVSPNSWAQSKWFGYPQTVGIIILNHETYSSAPQPGRLLQGSRISNHRSPHSSRTSKRTPLGCMELCSFYVEAKANLNRCGSGIGTE